MPDNINGHYIVREHPIRIITKCKRHSKGTLMSFLLGVMIIYVFLNWIPEAASIFFPVTNVDLMSRMGSYDRQLLEVMPRTPLVIYFYGMFFNGVFKFGEALYTLTYIRNRKVEYRAISEGFSMYGKTLALFIVQVLIVGFWSMLFVIPGIIATINFSQAFYILADDPSKGITQVLSESKIMMTGNRMNYVRLILFYLPYLMLGYAPSLVLSELALRYNLSQTSLVIIAMLAEIPVFAAHGYICLGRAVFYELLQNGSFAKFRYAGQDAFREMENPDPTNN